MLRAHASKYSAACIRRVACQLRALYHQTERRLWQG